MSEASHSDIAIVGMALRVPGAGNPSEFWQNLRSGTESIQRYTDDDLLRAGERPDRLQHPNYVKAGAPLDRMEHFDGEFFGFGPRESAILDPQHRHFLEVSWEALEDAGHPPESFPGSIGVFAGCGMGSYFYFNLCTNPDLVNSMGMFLLRHTGNDKDFLATRLSYLLNLRGPSINVQTACSTSLVAVHLACQSLLAGECDLALAGGVTIELPHRRGYIYQEREILSPDGHCRAFDHRAQGTVFGSGAGVVVLRRFKDALEAGDRIYAVIKGSAVNNDGATKAGYLAPSVDGQAAAIAEALAVANVSADSIEYVECHGTGTYLGDPIEVTALTQAFRETTDRKGYCFIGSVKTNIGHLDTAAGVASLIKVCLSLKNEEIAPSLSFEAPNPAIDFAGSPFKVVTERTDWKRGTRPRRATVNSLGVGGTNAHVVLEEAPTPAPSSATARAFHPLVLSAKNRAALDAQCERLADYLAAHPEVPLADVSHSLFTTRRHFDQRRVLAASSHDEASALLWSKDPKRTFSHTFLGEGANVVFMLPGGGAQYVNMARGLYAAQAVFRQFVDRGLDYLKDKVPFDPRTVLFAEGDGIAQAQKALLKPSVQLPLIYIVEYALAKLWMALGVKPQALIGHSLGENTAAALADVMSFEDGIGLVLLRGQLFDGVPPGGMLSVAMPAEELAREIGDELDIACINAPELCVVSGPNAPLGALLERLTARGIEAQRIPIDIAAHSRMLEPILEPFGAHLRSLDLRAPRIPFVSNRSGALIRDDEATNPDYWVDHLRHTVRFSDGIATLAKDENRIFLEVGPGRTLGSLAKAGGAVKQGSVLPSLRHQDEVIDDAAFFTAVHARLWALGIDLGSETFYPGEKRAKVPLPTYAFQGQRHWIDPGKQIAEEHGDALPMKEPNPSKWFFRAAWRQRDAELPEEADRLVWLVFADDAAVSDKLIPSLRSAGHDVIVVREGDAFYKLSNDEYRLAPEHGLEGYETLVRELLASGKAPNRIFHAWLLTDKETHRPGSSFFHRNQERGFFSLLFLAQALGAQDYPKPLHIVVATSGLFALGDEVSSYPEKATVLGPVRVMSREFPGVTCRLIDVALPREARKIFGVGVPPRAEPLFNALVPPNGASRNDPRRRELIARLGMELGSTLSDEVVALRDGQRWVQSFEPATLREADHVSFKERGVYLVTGGFGGIAAVVARDLARRFRARLVLVGRTPLPNRTEFAQWLDRHPNDPLSERIRFVQELEALGAEVLACSADVTDVDRMREVVEEAVGRFGSIDGVLHAAGALDDQPMLGKRQTDVENVLAPKVYGTLVLSEALQGKKLDFFVLFSSTSAATAPAGQVDYVAANSFMDAFSTSAAGRAHRVLSLAWGIWKEVGMAERTLRALRHASGPEPKRTSVHHPLLDARTDGPRGEIDLVGRWSVQTHWMLDEHRTAARQALLPGTGYLELLRAAAAAVESVRALEIRDLYFLRPLYAPDDDAVEVRVRLEGDEHRFDAEISTVFRLDDGRVGWAKNAQASIVLAEPEAVASLDLGAIEGRCTRLKLGDKHGTPLRTGQENHLSFGPRWRVLKSAAYGTDEAIARLELPERFEHDLGTYGLHPAVLDLATGYAMDLIPGYDASTLWVPISYQSVRVHASLPRVVHSWVRLSRAVKSGEPFVSFDVTVTDETGRVLVEVEEFTIRRLEDPAFDVSRDPEPNDLSFETSASPARELSNAELAFQHLVSQGITQEEGPALLERVLKAVPRGSIIASSMDIGRLRAQAEASKPTEQSEGQKFSRPNLDSEFVAPRDDIERTLVEIWQDVLGVQGIGVQDSFFDLGGHSLIAVRLFAKIKRTFSVDYPISILFDAPTIEQCAQRLREKVVVAAKERPSDRPPETRRRYTHLVRMHPGEPQAKTPFFLVAGMFGNVLNLRHLALLVGTDRPFYGLQARGLYGDHEPHETFEEMARDYILELRTVQPHGPYVLGGFSGGGIAAYEMARQLIAAGESVSQLVLLDTPLPGGEPLSRLDKLSMRFQDFQRAPTTYPLNWALEKLKYRERTRQRDDRIREQQAGSSQDFHSEVIEAAFYRALARYELVPLTVPVALFRPKLRQRYWLPGGRAINSGFHRVLFDNGWGQIVREVAVHEVPGDHDSMVLEPNVRVLANHLRDCLDAVDRDHALCAPLAPSFRESAE
jgi:acyl transferase domain-containing protein/thioesterase domain-containing protein